MSKEEVKKLIINAIKETMKTMRIDGMGGVWGESCAEILALIQLVEEKKEEEPEWEIYQVRNDEHNNEITYHQEGPDDIYEIYDVMGAKSVLDIKEWYIKAIRIKSTGEIYSLGDKVVWNWAPGSRHMYMTLSKFWIDMEEDNNYQLKFQVRENQDVWYKICKLTHQIWNLRHYIEPETTEMTVDGTIYRVPKSMADSINRILQDALTEVKETTQKSQQRPIKPEVILRTEDGVSINDEKQMIYGVRIRDWYCTERIAKNHNRNITEPHYKWYSTPEDRQEYIEYHKPILSQKEIMEEVIAKTLNLPYQQEVMETIKCALDNYVISKMGKEE